MSGKRVNRRQFVSVSVAAAGSAALCCAPTIAQGSAHVVVIGGGFAGATCARQLKRLDRKIQVTLVETNPTFIACPFSNAGHCGLPGAQCAAVHVRESCCRRHCIGCGESNSGRARCPYNLARGRSEAFLRPPNLSTGYRYPLGCAARLWRGGGRADAARVEGWRTDASAAPAVGNDGRWRPSGDFGAGQSVPLSTRTL